MGGRSDSDFDRPAAQGPCNDSAIFGPRPDGLTLGPRHQGLSFSLHDKSATQHFDAHRITCRDRGLGFEVFEPQDLARCDRSDEAASEHLARIGDWRS